MRWIVYGLLACLGLTPFHTVLADKGESFELAGVQLGMVPSQAAESIANHYGINTENVYTDGAGGVVFEPRYKDSKLKPLFPVEECEERLNATLDSARYQPKMPITKTFHYRNGKEGVVVTWHMYAKDEQPLVTKVVQTRQDKEAELVDLMGLAYGSPTTNKRGIMRWCAKPSRASNGGKQCGVREGQYLELRRQKLVLGDKAYHNRQVRVALEQDGKEKTEKKKAVKK